jgi:hypothetical protein
MKTLGIVLAVFCALFIAVMVIGSNTDYPEVAETVVLRSDYASGCPSKSATAQLLSLSNQGDSKAAGEFAYRARCTFLRTGQPFILHIKEPFEDYWCIRRQGEPSCL